MPNPIKTSADKIVEKHMNKIYNRVPSLQSENFKLCIRMAATDCAILEVDSLIVQAELLLTKVVGLDSDIACLDEMKKNEDILQELKSRIV